jgi:Tfp pilus assembly protein PilO
MILKNNIKSMRLALKSAPKERVFLWLILILSVGFILYQFLIIFQIRKLKAVDLYFLSQKKLLDFYEQIMENTNIFKKELGDAENAFRITKEKFVNEEDLPNYFTHFRELAKSHGLKVLTLDFKPQEAITDSEGKPLTYYQKLRFSVALKGDYFDAMRLLYELEYVSPKIFDVQTLSIKQQNSESRQVLADIDVVVYILMEKKQDDEI